MSAPRKQWLLKVIAGPHQGAEMLLPVGKTLIGSDDACDVVLHDVLVAPQHVEMELTASGATAAPLGGRVFVAGKRVREARQSVPDFVFISIGGTHFVIGGADSKWPLLSSADVPALEKDVDNSQEGSSSESGSNAKPAAANEQSETVPSGPHPSAPAAPARFQPLVGILAGLLILAAWVFVYQSFMHRSAPEGQESTSSTPASRAREVVEQMGMKDAVTVNETAGRLTISGYVDTEAKQRELQSAIREVAPGAATKIYSLEKIASSARTLIDANHLPLTASSLSEGKLRVAGRITSTEPWIRVRQMLLREVPGLSGIEDEVEIDAVVNSPSLTLPSSRPATGNISSVSAPAPKEDPATGYHITPSTIDTPESTIASIKTSVEGLSFMRLSTGGVYFVGARLPYGGALVRIEADAVTVLEKGENRILRLGDLVIRPKPEASEKPSASITKTSD